MCHQGHHAQISFLDKKHEHHAAQHHGIRRHTYHTVGPIEKKCTAKSTVQKFDGINAYSGVSIACIPLSHYPRLSRLHQADGRMVQSAVSNVQALSITRCTPPQEQRSLCSSRAVDHLTAPRTRLFTADCQIDCVCVCTPACGATEYPCGLGRRTSLGHGGLRKRVRFPCGKKRGKRRGGVHFCIVWNDA